MSNDPYKDDKETPYDETKKKKKTKDTGVKTLDDIAGKEEVEKAQKEVAGAAEVLETPEVPEKPSLAVVPPQSKTNNAPPLDKTSSGKKPPKEPVHIFFDPDIKKIIKQKQKDKGRGWKSTYVNNLVRWAFEQEGWIEPKE